MADDNSDETAPGTSNEDRAIRESLRDTLKKALTADDTPASALAGISRELRAVLAELAAMGPAEPKPGGSELERIQRERALRHADPADTPPSA